MHSIMIGRVFGPIGSRGGKTLKRFIRVGALGVAALVGRYARRIAVGRWWGALAVAIR